jgi:hypothetical protein
MHAAFGGGADRKGLRPQYLAGGLLYTQNGLGTWSKTKLALALRLLGMNQEQQRAHLYALTSMFDVAGAHLVRFPRRYKADVVRRDPGNGWSSPL